MKRTKFRILTHNADIVLFVGFITALLLVIFLVGKIGVRTARATDSIYLPLVQSPPRAVPTRDPSIPTQYSYVKGSLQAEPNCGIVYMQGIVVDKNNIPVNGVTVELNFWDNWVYRVSGEGGVGNGRWGFTPLDGSNIRFSAIPFNIRIVKSESDPTPLSETLFIDFRSACWTGQLTNIQFQDMGKQADRFELPESVQDGEQFSVDLSATKRDPTPPVTVPEPITFTLFGMGLAGLGTYLRKNRTRS